MFVRHFGSLGLFALLTFLSLPSQVPLARLFRKYKLIHEAVENVRVRPEAPFYAFLRKFNRTTPVIDATFEVKDPIVNSWQTWIDGYERLGLDHTYTKSAVSITSSFCEFICGKFIINRGFRNFGNMPTSCPLKVGNYSIRNYYIEDKYLPPVVPGEHWRLDFISGPDGTKNTNQSSLMAYYFQIVYL